MMQYNDFSDDELTNLENTLFWHELLPIDPILRNFSK